MAAPKKATAAPKKAATTSAAVLADHGSKADRQAAHEAAQQALVSGPSKPKTYSADDNSIDARMWRLNQDHIAMGARK